MLQPEERPHLDEAGATSIEYALIATLVSVFILVALQNFASVTGVLYTLIAALTGGSV